MIEGIVYLARKLHWSREEIGKLSPIQFNEILKEVSFQESQEEYRNQFDVASLLAAIYNTIPRRHGSHVFKASDFLTGDEPQRIPEPKVSLEKMAEEKGIELPKE